MIKDIGVVSDQTTQSVSVERRTSEYFWRHVRHTSSYAGVESAFRVMNRHVEVGEVNVSVGIQDNIVRLNITTRRNQPFVSTDYENPVG